MRTLGVTHTVCPICRDLIAAKVVTDGSDVYYHSVCPAHGPSERFVRSDVGEYLRAQRYVKPAWVPRQFSGRDDVPCPAGCGFCRRHEQHVCLPIVEITSRCDLACPICLTDAAGDEDMTVEQFGVILDGLIAAEGQVDVLNLSGGEPLMHPGLVGLLDEALRRPEIVRVSVSTNGLALLTRADLLDALKQRNVAVSLQFDGFNDDVYTQLRGRPLLEEKLATLDRLAEWDIPTSLTVTAAAGVNDDQFGGLLDLLFGRDHVISMMIQPLAFAGRAAALTGRMGRLTLPDVVRLLGAAGDPRVVSSDFVPLPCSHPLCFSLAYYLMLDGGGSAALSRLVDAPTMMDTLANRGVFGLDPGDHTRLTDLVYDLWSGPAGSVPDAGAVLATLRGILDEATCECFDPRRVFTIAERKIKSIFIHAFQDAETFDLARCRRCCNAYPQPDGRLMPVCVYNVLHRGRTGAK